MKFKVFGVICIFGIILIFKYLCCHVSVMMFFDSLKFGDVTWLWHKCGFWELFQKDHSRILSQLIVCCLYLMQIASKIFVHVWFCWVLLHDSQGEMCCCITILLHFQHQDMETNSPPRKKYFNLVFVNYWYS